MRLPAKIAIGCGVAFTFFLVFGFIAFPKLIKGKIKKMVTLDKSSEVRGLFVKIPFPLDFKVYLFNVTNPMDVHNGAIPQVQEVGPFCFEEWKEKVDVQDEDSEDAMFYRPKDTFLKAHWPGCLSGNEMITMPHPMILGMINAVTRSKPAMLNLLSKAVKSVFRNPETIFLTAKAIDILFDGIIIDCSGIADFAGKAVCTQLKTEVDDLRHVSENELAFSFMAPKNATPGKVFKVLRGVQKSHDVGRILEYDGKKEMNAWPTEKCNQISGTDGTIFPPLMKKEEGLASFAPDLCRSLVAVYSKKEKYDGIPVSLFTATLGDMSKNPDEKCYCPTPETCLKKGMMDLFNCVGVPIIASLPHFYESDESYLKGVKGLNPNEEDHGIRIYFELLSGSPVAAKKRLMFSMPLEPNPKVTIFNNLPSTIIPLLWVEEGVALNNTFTKPLKDLFMIKKVVKIVSWLVMIGSLIGLAVSGYFMAKQSGEVNITKVQKISPEKNGMNGHDNHAMSDNEIDKF